MGAASLQPVQQYQLWEQFATCSEDLDATNPMEYGTIMSYRWIKRPGEYQYPLLPAATSVDLIITSQEKDT